MNIFIDANIFLDFFRLSTGDLEELRKITALSRAGTITLLISSTVLDEFSRNRERVIAKSIEQFKSTSFSLHRPNIVRAHDESSELEELRLSVETTKKTLLDKVESEAQECSTKADVVILELFNAIPDHDVDEAVYELAAMRVRKGKPPGKPGSIGDAVHWEWLLQVVPNGDDLHLISRDGDFQSPINKGNLADYLSKEWTSHKASSCKLYHSLTQFLNQNLDDVRLVDEIDKQGAIVRLQESLNFTTTHNAIADLDALDDFSPEEIKLLLESYISNNQISLIIGDEDVLKFAHKIIILAYEMDLIDEAFPLEEMINDLELDNA